MTRTSGGGEFFFADAFGQLSDPSVVDKIIDIVHQSKKK